MGYIVKLEVFYGPLDLLLFLIEKNEVDIYDIPIAKITSQYIEHISKFESIDMEQLGDFLLIASYLLNLKSKMLLPKHNLGVGQEDEHTEDPRSDLVERLLEYKKFKEAARYLSDRQAEAPQVFRRNSDFVPATNEVLIANVDHLVRAYKEILDRCTEPIVELNIPENDISIAEKMQELLKMIYNKPKGLVFQSIFSGVNSRREALAFFLALLELIRLQKVSAYQKGLNDLIIINLMGEYDYDDERTN